MLTAVFTFKVAVTFGFKILLKKSIKTLIILSLIIKLDMTKFIYKSLTGAFQELLKCDPRLIASESSNWQ